MYSGSFQSHSAPRNGLCPFRSRRPREKEASLRNWAARRVRGARLHWVAESRETFSERARSAEGGFGLIELLIAMVILNVGLLAIIASFQAGIITLGRASRVTTAAVLADQQMELYRAITWDSIRLASATIPATAPYTSDPAYTCSGCSTQITAPTCSGPPYPDECNASRAVPGADNKRYRLNTYITQTAPAGGRPVKQVTIVVRDEANQSRVYVRQASTFDVSTG
jgi:Tfp pilus assembly protein PilV